MPLLVLLLLLSGLSSLMAAPMNLTLPTDNTALFEGQGEDFYMYTTRHFEGTDSKPWTGGQYGFTRNLIRTQSEGILATRFHEGLDIRPVKRDSRGNPLDSIYAITDGTVVLVQNNKGASNYGRYLVIEHDWGEGKIYSLYAHLSAIQATLGQQVQRGDTVAIMGFTGRGINRERAHLHVELCLLISEQFDAYHSALYGGKSAFGIYHGWNLLGMDLASILRQEKENPALTIAGFLGQASPYYRVAVPREADEPLEIAQRYPWLQKGDHSKPSRAWEISFTNSGIPLAVTPSQRVVVKPTVTFVRPTPSKHEYHTQRRLTGTGRRASLTRNGEKFLSLFTNSYAEKTATPVTE